MTCRRDELVEAQMKLLERLDENLVLSLKGSQRSGVTTVLDDDGVTTVWDEGGTTAFLWHASSPEKGICLHFLAPVCGLPQGDRTLFYERLMDPSGYEGPFTWQMANGQISLVGNLPVEGLTDILIRCLVQDLLQAAKAAVVYLVERFGVRPWHGDEVMNTGIYWGSSEPGIPLDTVEQNPRATFPRIHPRSVLERFLPTAVKNAHMRWRDPSQEDDPGTRAVLPKDAYLRNPDWGKFMRINRRLERKLWERLTSLLLDLATLHEFQVFALEGGGLGLRRKDIVIDTGFEPTVEGGVYMYCQAELCKLPIYPSDELYRGILSTAFDPLSAKVWVHEDTVGVCGYLDSRFVTNETARHLILSTLTFAERVHDELTQGFGLKSLCRPEEDTVPDPDTEDLFEED